MPPPQWRSVRLIAVFLVTGFPVLIFPEQSAGDELKERATLRGAGHICCVAFSPNGKFLAAGGADKAIILWDVTTYKEVARWPAHDDWILSLRFTDDGRALVSIDKSKTVRVWDVATRKQIKSWEDPTAKKLKSLPPDRHSLQHQSCTYIAGESGRSLLVAGQDDNGVCSWDLSRDTRLRMRDNAVQSFDRAAFSPGCRMLAATATHWNDPEELDRVVFKERVCIWEMSTQRERLVFDPLMTVDAMTFSPDGRTFAFGGRRSIFKPLLTEEDRAAMRKEKPRDLVIWDLIDNKERFALGGHRGSVHDLDFHPQGRLLASVDDAGILKLWDVATGREVVSPAWKVDIVMESLTCLRFSPDGKLLAVGSTRDTIRLIEVTSGEGESAPCDQGTTTK